MIRLYFKLSKINKNKLIFFCFELNRHGDWGLGIGDWGLGLGPNPQYPLMFLFFNKL